MNIVVYCGSCDGVAEKYIRAARDLGACIGQNGHGLVYGASNCGLMGVLAQSAHEHGAKIYGVGLEMFHSRVGAYGLIDDLYVAKTFSERRNKMIELGDAFIALPGGTGTLDEISEILCIGKFYFPDKEIIFFDVDGFYQGIKDYLSHAEKEGFLYPGQMDRVHFARTIEEIDVLLGKAK